MQPHQCSIGKNSLVKCGEFLLRSSQRLKNRYLLQQVGMSKEWLGHDIEQQYYTSQLSMKVFYWTIYSHMTSDKEWLGCDIEQQYHTSLSLNVFYWIIYSHMTSDSYWCPPWIIYPCEVIFYCKLLLQWSNIVKSY